MSQVTFLDKTQNVEYDPSKINAQDINELKTATNTKADQSSLDLLKPVARTGSYNDLIDRPVIDSGNASIDDTIISAEKTYSSAKIETSLVGKANKVSGTVPLSELPPVYFNGVSGSGTSADPYTVSGGGSGNAEAYLKGLPGYIDGEEKVLYGGINGFSWGAVPSGGSLEKLATPTITFATPAIDGVGMSWNAVANATSYTLQRASDVSYADATNVYSGANKQFTDTGLSISTTYYYRLKAFGSGFAASDYFTGNITTPATGNITPARPTGAIVNDTSDTFDWTFSSGYSSLSSYEYTLDAGSSYNTVTAKPISIGNISKAGGTVGVRVKADTGRNASGTLFNPSAYTVAAVKAAAPTAPVTNDTANTFDFTFNPNFTSISQYEYTLNAGSTYTTATEKPISVGDFNKAAGQVGVRVKAATSVLVSDTLYNNIPFTGTDGLTGITTWLQSEGFIVNANNLQAPDDSQLNRARSSAYIPAGQAGSIQCQGYGRIGLDDNPSELSYGTQFNYGVNCNSANHKLTTTVGTAFTDAGAVPGTTVPYVRLRVTPTAIYFGYSLDGATWTEPRNVARTGGDLYVKADEGYSRLDYVNKILGSGILINSALS